ncbi:MAG: DUF4169 family protein [Sphingobacteriales bacterium]|nr:MAG: DUF4169 family protein [Sphingobacteriales bacterium]
MADIINLRTARKQKARDAKEAQSAQNRLKFGRTRAEKELSKATSELDAKRIDGHKREDQE